jgi:hypothetical protein
MGADIIAGTKPAGQPRWPDRDTQRIVAAVSDAKKDPTPAAEEAATELDVKLPSRMALEDAVANPGPPVPSVAGEIQSRRGGNREVPADVEARRPTSLVNTMELPSSTGARHLPWFLFGVFVGAALTLALVGVYLSLR